MSEGVARVHRARFRLKRAEQPQANTMGRLFFGSVSFIRIKEMNSSMKDEKRGLIQVIKLKRKNLLIQCPQSTLPRTRIKHLTIIIDSTDAIGTDIKDQPAVRCAME